MSKLSDLFTTRESLLMLLYLLVLVGIIFSVNMLYDPAKIKEAANKKILDRQTQEYHDYASNKEVYRTIYHRDIDGVDFSIVIGENDDLFYVQYNDGDNVFFKPLGTVELPMEDDSHALKERLSVESDPYEIELYVFYGHHGPAHLSDMYYIHVVDTDTTIGLGEHETSDADIMIDDVRWRLNYYAQTHLVGYISLSMYDISYENGQLIRSGSIGERVGWNIKGDNGDSLSRSAENEIMLDLSTLDWFQKGVTYTVYIDAHIDTIREYRPVSKAITFVYE